MISLEMNKFITKLTEKLQKYQHYHQVKLINMSILQTMKFYLPIGAKFTYSALGKHLQKQKKVKVDTLKSSNHYSKIDEL